MNHLTEQFHQVLPRTGNHACFTSGLKKMSPVIRKTDKRNPIKQKSKFPDEQSKVAFAMSQLIGRAALWGMVEGSRELTLCPGFIYSYFHGCKTR